MPDTDRYGLALSAGPTAAAHYRHGVDLLLSAWPGAIAAFDAAIAEEPGFALAHIARARVLGMHARIAEARAAAAEARRHAAGLTAREAAHLDLLAGLIEGQGARVMQAAPAHLDEHPRDALVLSLLLGAFGLYAFSGRADHDALRTAICDRLAPAYGRDWWFLGYRGWAHTEAGNPRKGLSYTEAALALREANGNAAHALGHACFELGALARAEEFLDDFLPDYPADAILHGHLCWHVALSALERGDTARALELFETRLAPGHTTAPPLNAFTDAASLLWRLALAGAPAAPHHIAVAAYGAAQFPAPGLAFADVHAALADALAGRHAALAARITGLDPARPWVAALCRGAAAFAAQDWAGALAHWRPAMADLVRIGGSHAQRELFEDSVIAASLHAGERDTAATLLRARLAHRASARDAAWLAQAGH